MGLMIGTRAGMIAVLTAWATLSSAATTQNGGRAGGGTVVVRSVAELAAALDRARSGGVRIIRLAAGRYALTAPILVDARLSGMAGAPFVIEAVPGATVELSGARALPALRWEA